jgi:signal transduction histidine kinase
MIAARAREVAQAATCALVLPSIGGRLVLEIADGNRAHELVGLVLPPDGRSATVLTEGIGMIVDSLAHAYTLRVQELRVYGPALYAPLRTEGRGIGVMVLLRLPGEPNFDQADLGTAESFAQQAALALVLSEARHAHDLKSLLNERQRIARDLHDLAIQQLFATGMELEVALTHVRAGEEPEGLEESLSKCLDTLDQTVKEIRSIVHELRDSDAEITLTERLRREASLARSGLGFAPSMVMLYDGQTATPQDEDHMDRLIPRDLADDIVAVAREGLSNAARHAGASSVAVTVAVTKPSPDHPQGRAEVIVDDDGTGMPPKRVRSSGLRNLLERARARGGTCRARSHSAGHGTVLEWRTPLNY